MNNQNNNAPVKDYYVAYCDGCCEPINPKGNMGTGAFILSPERKKIFEISEYRTAKEMNYETSNNVAEYIGIIAVFEYFTRNNLQNEKIIICGDSKLVINQMAGEWKCNGGIYEKYYHQALQLRQQFTQIRFEWIPREKNEIADELSKRGMIKAGCEFRIQKI
jgi:ribonuclease HI